MKIFECVKTMTKQKVLGSIKLFEDLTIEIVEGSEIKHSETQISTLGEINYPLTFINNRFSTKFSTIKLPENFPIEALIAELNHYYVNRLFFSDTIHDYQSLLFSCFVSEIMIHSYLQPCETCETFTSKECWKKRLKEITEKSGRK